MSRPLDEDLFEETKMTFGEHLEELRVSLFKALFCLLVGFIIGLFYGAQVVRIIEGPLKVALLEFYEDKAIDQFLEVIRARADEGNDLPPSFREILELDDEEEAKTRLQSFMGADKLLPQEVYIQPSQVLDLVEELLPELVEGVERPQAPETGLHPDDMVRIYFWRPLRNDPRTLPVTLNVQESFFIYIKAALVTGVALSSPFVFYFLWSFVAAGLYPHEKHYVHIFLPFSLALFLAGAALAFFVVFRFVLTFLLSFNAWLGIDIQPRLSEWISFALILPLGFGISFQLPLIMLFLERIGVFTIESYLEKWRIAVLVIFVISMLLTPADPTSMISMAVPLTGLYFGGILLCRFMPKKKSPFQ